MPRENKNREKTVQEYRKDIFTLKSKLRQDEEYLDELRQKCSEVDIFSQQTYTFQMKVKILENDLAAVKQKIFKYSKDEFSQFYTLNFCAYALSRACTIVSVTPEMAYRCVDVEGRGTVKTEDLSNFFREVLRLDAELINPLLRQLDSKETGYITQTGYLRMIRSFMLETEKDESERSQINQAVERICRQMAAMQAQPHLIFDTKMLNVALTVGALRKKLKNLQNLDCVALYCRCDPTKQGAIQTQAVVKFLENKIENLRHFNSMGSAKNIRLKQ